jgi:hypothetical protein
MAFFQPTTVDRNLFNQSVKSSFIKINLLNNYGQVIDSMSGEATTCSVQIDANSSVRRTCNIAFYVRNFSNINQRIWMDKNIDLYVGYKYLLTGEIIWYRLGKYFFNNTNFTFSSTDRSVSATCSDAMCNLTGERKGQLSASSIVIPAESNIRDVIIALLTDNTDLPYYLIEDNPNTIPYDLTFSNGTNISDIIIKIRDLFPGWECFFDVDGVFVYQTIPTLETAPNFVDASFFTGKVTNEQIRRNFNEVKNVVTVWGKDNINSTWKDQNPYSPYYVGTIGEFPIVLSGNEYDAISTQDLCDQRSAFEGWGHTRLNDGYTIEMFAAPWFDVNKLFNYTSLMSGETNDFISKSINMDLMSGMMTLNMNRFYPQYPEIINTDWCSHL